jgi:hypothetical protein
LKPGKVVRSDVPIAERHKDGCVSAEQKRPTKHTVDPTRLGSIFHEPWWLDVVTGGQFDEVSVDSSGTVVGRLPYVTKRWMGFKLLLMPPFTHVLGPAVVPGNGKPQTQLSRRLSIIRSLIDQLPPNDYFMQILGDVSIDALAFQDRGFQVLSQYTFEIDCRVDLDKIWTAMNFKTRQHVRRGQEAFSITTVEDPNHFVRFYRDNLRKQGRVSFLPLETFPALFSETHVRGCGELLSANRPDGKPAAMIFLVWDQGTMYYLLSTRCPDAGDSNTISLLLWSAIERAHKRGLTFDLDGVSSSGTARFLSNFGGRPKIRMVVQRSGPVYGAIQYMKQAFARGYRNDTSTFF